MIALAIEIVAFLVVAWAVLVVLVLLGAVGAAVTEWLDEVPGRRKGLWWTLGALGVVFATFVIWTIAPHVGDVLFVIEASAFPAYLVVGWFVIVIGDAIRARRQP